ncbi:protein of unknown function [Pararobbsia alpina]|uniref:TIGR01841 family phasin n=1 Tax=Pararobbsia alpina TaxID=621374 RepID=UPI0039A61A8B
MEESQLIAVGAQAAESYQRQVFEASSKFAQRLTELNSRAFERASNEQVAVEQEARAHIEPSELLSLQSSNLYASQAKWFAYLSHATEIGLGFCEDVLAAFNQSYFSFYKTTRDEPAQLVSEVTEGAWKSVQPARRAAKQAMAVVTPDESGSTTH